MAVIRWTEAMSVGVESLDRDHQMLIGLINRMELAGDEVGTRTRVLPEVLATLIAYTVFHFEREEKVMEVCGYPELESHHEEHRALTREVQELQRRFRNNDPSLTREEMLSFLTAWLNHHILLHDLAYRETVAGRLEAEKVARAHGDFSLGSLFGIDVRGEKGVPAS
jgi:hemerythrin